MKKITSTVVILAMLVGCLLTLTSCGKLLSGKYEADLAIAEYTYEFGIFGNVTLTVDPIFGDDRVYEGKYKVSDDGLQITFTFDGEDAERYNGTVNFAIGEENGAKYIKLDGDKYEKVD